MKKILAFLGAAIFMGSGASSVVSCDDGKIAVADLSKVNFSNISSMVAIPGTTDSQIKLTLQKKAVFDVADYLKVKVSDTETIKKIDKEIQMDPIKYYDDNGELVPFIMQNIPQNKSLRLSVTFAGIANAKMVSGKSEAIDIYTSIELKNAKAPDEGYTLDLSVKDNQKLPKAKETLIKAAIKENSSLFKNVDPKTMVARIYVKDGEGSNPTREMTNDQDLKNYDGSSQVTVVLAKADGWNFLVGESQPLKVKVIQPSDLNLVSRG